MEKWLILLLSILILLIIYFAFKRKQLRKLIKRNQEERKKAKELLRKLRKQKIPLSAEEEKIKQINDFRSMLLRNMESADRKIRKSLKFKPKKIKEEIMIRIPEEKQDYFVIPTREEREEIREKALEKEKETPEIKKGLFNMFD